MTKKKQRKPRQPRAGRGKGRISKLNGTKGATSEPGKVVLDKMQSMAVNLMAARETIKTKNVQLARLQQQKEAQAKADADRISDLETQVTDLTNQLMQAQIDAEDARTEVLCKELGLPRNAEYKMGPDGNYFYETGAEPEPEDDEPERSGGGSDNDDEGEPEAATQENVAEAKD